ncbi:MAG TPA: hypothetical protein VH592_26970 [Gemmataceae bacterium]|jgi:hypothetical protein
MRNMLALFGAALLTVVGVGWYLGWYKVRNQPASVPGQHSVNIDIDTNKVRSDLEQGEQKIQQWLEKKNSDDSKKPDGNLMLPSPGVSQSAKTKSNSNSLFPGHSDKKGLSIEIGDPNHPLIQIGASDKK